MKVEPGRVLFIVGPPGVGKTTLVRALFATLDPLEAKYLVDKPKWTVAPGICAAGHYKGDTFDGADTVPYNGVNQCLDFWTKNLSTIPLTIFDGDRFSFPACFDFFKAKGHPVRVAHISAPPEVLAERRRSRGSKQNPSWMKGRETKALRFAERDPTAVRIQGDGGASVIREVLLRELGGW